METCGVKCGRDARQPLQQLLLAHHIARTRIDAGRRRERGAQRHADAHSRRARILLGVDDALVVIFGIHDHDRVGRPRGPDSPCARRASNDNCGTCAAIHNSRGSSASAAWESGPRGRRRRRPHP